MSKWKQSSPCENSHPKYFKTTDFARLHREALLGEAMYANIITSFELIF